MGAAILETAVLSEISKTITHRAIAPQLYFWRTSTGVKVDIIADTGSGLVPIEVKLSGTPRPAMASAIRSFRDDLGEQALPGYVMHAGTLRLPLGRTVTALPFADL